MPDDAALLLAEAEEQIEAWLCELDAEWLGILERARTEAAAMVARAMTDAAELLAAAESQAAEILAAAARDASAMRDAVARDVADVDDTGRVGADDLAALASAVEQLRVELSRVVEAAFDALPAVEATAAALRTVDAEATDGAPTPRRRRGLFRRLTRSRA